MPKMCLFCEQEKKTVEDKSTVFFSQGQKDSNPRPSVLETGTLPAELYPYLKIPTINYSQRV
jgi:hypothetical protein